MDAISQAASDRVDVDHEPPSIQADGGRNVHVLWDQFLAQHSHWYEQRVTENESLFALPNQMIGHRIRSLFQISEEHVAAERSFAEFCELALAIGVCNDQPIRYRWLRPIISCPTDELLCEMTQHGWTEDNVRTVTPLVNASNDICERMKGSVGRLICSPRFCQERDELQNLWQGLPASHRPTFPLIRSPKMSELVDEFKASEPASPELLGFATAFNRFCDSWQIMGFATWELPDVSGPKWPTNDVLPRDEPPGRVVIDTPWHLYLRANDPVGELVRADHAQLVTERGVNDLGHWQTYANLFDISFWDRVLRNRYCDHKRPRGFVTAMNTILADIVGLESSRVSKLRKLHSKLLNGKLASLARHR